MSLLEKNIEEQINRLIPNNDYLNAIAKAVLKQDNDELEYLKSKIKKMNEIEKELIYRDFNHDINGNLLFDNDGNKISGNIIEDAETTNERKVEFSQSS